MDNMDLLLKEAFEEMVTQEYENRPLEFPEHRFSLKFRLKMRRLMKQIDVGEQETEEKTSLLELYRPIRSKRKLVVLIALMLLLLGGTVVAAKTLITWLYQITLEQQEDHVKVNRQEAAVSENVTEVTEGSFRKYQLTKIPEGYHLVEEKFSEVFNDYKVVYINEQKETLLFRQNGQKETTVGNITSYKEDMEEINVNNFEGYFVKDYDTASLILSDGEYLIEIFGNFTKEELITLAEGLEILEE